MGDGETRISQRAVPMISYEDVAAAAGWLARAFGFRERGARYTDEEGRTTHAELELDGAAVMLGWPGPDYQDPARPPGHVRPRGPGRRRRSSSTASSST